MKKRSTIEVIALIGALLVLGGAAAERWSLPRPQDATAYHDRVREASHPPDRVGDWTGKDIPVPVEAAAALRANLIVSRQYTNPVEQRSIQFILVQCRDVRDLVPHFPPVCYPGRGLTLSRHEPRDWNIDGIAIRATEYEFDSNDFQHDRPVIVENFMLLPNGEICPDMNEVRREIPLRNRYFGAAQVQIVTDADMSAEDRDALVKEFVAAYKPLISVILSGVG